MGCEFCYLNLKVMKHGGLVGTYDEKVGKKAQDVEPKKRYLALRAIAGDRESDSAGVVCWILTATQKKTKVNIKYLNLKKNVIVIFFDAALMTWFVI